MLFFYWLFLFFFLSTLGQLERERVASGSRQISFVSRLCNCYGVRRILINLSLNFHVSVSGFSFLNCLLFGSGRKEGKGNCGYLLFRFSLFFFFLGRLGFMGRLEIGVL